MAGQRIRGRSTQRYQVFKDVEARRVVESRVCDVRVHVQHEGANAGTMGESSFIAVDARTLPGALDAAFSRARLVKNKPWTLPGAGEGGAASVRSVDSQIVEAADEAAESVGRTIEGAVRARSTTSDPIELSASEVFCDYRRVHLRNSRGLDLVREDTNAYTEYVLLAKGRGEDGSSRCTRAAARAICASSRSTSRSTKTSRPSERARARRCRARTSSTSSSAARAPKRSSTRSSRTHRARPRSTGGRASPKASRSSRRTATRTIA